MAGNGPPPAATKRRRNKDPLEDTAREIDPTEVPDELAGFDLPPLSGEDDWHPMTKGLWLALRRSPLLVDEPELGWLFLLDTALMHHTMWQKGRWEFAAELRLRLAKYGVTPEDRARLRIKITTPKDKAPAEPTPSAQGSRRRGLHIAG